jgi:hypothetical protein
MWLLTRLAQSHNAVKRFADWIRAAVVGRPTTPGWGDVIAERSGGRERA